MFHHLQKDVLYRIAVTQGIQAVEELGQYLPVPPTPRVNGWLRKFLQTPKNFAPTRRYVNRFKLGADPEFCFAANGGANGTGRADAHIFGLMQGPAFGADNNGRLAEIRPYPSRSAVEVVASILTTLRWMAVLYPQTYLHDWVSGAYLWDDGIGGHVHFGRKRPTRRAEIAALDNIEECLCSLDVYPQDQVARRRRGDARRQIYGNLGDFRLQQHGYEYRTYPSWLDSPALAFLTLTVSKLAVQVPDLYRVRGHAELQRLRNFLAYFKTVDDDARLALVLLDRGLPRHLGGDFKRRWGIEVPAKTGKPNVWIVPPNIKPDSQSVTEVFEHLHVAAPIQFRVPEITWSPTRPLTGYRMVINDTTTILHKGLGEMIWDICCHEKFRITLNPARREATCALTVSQTLAKGLDRNWQQMTGLPRDQVQVVPNSDRCIFIAGAWREGSRARMLKRALLSGAFPLWRAQDCRTDSWEKWLHTTSPRLLTGKFAGKVLYGDPMMSNVRSL